MTTKAKGHKVKSISSMATTPSKVVRQAPKASVASVSAKKSPAKKGNAAKPATAVASPACNKPLIKRPAKALPQAPTGTTPTTSLTAPAVSPGNSKQSQLIAKLSADSGMTVQQMMELTGWQAHTVRGTISGVLRKKLGLNVACASENAGARVYRIIACAAAA